LLVASGVLGGCGGAKEPTAAEKRCQEAQAAIKRTGDKFHASDQKTAKHRAVEIVTTDHHWQLSDMLRDNEPIADS